MSEEPVQKGGGPAKARPNFTICAANVDPDALILQEQSEVEALTRDIEHDSAEARSQRLCLEILADKEERR